MRVLFERVDLRRYRIGLIRDGRYDIGVDIPLGQGPGSAVVPHDLVHFVVEEHLGLKLGIFGQAAAGASAGFFRPAPAQRSAARDTKRSGRLGHAGRADVARSERIAALVDQGGELREDEELAGPDHAALQRRLDEVLAQWRVARAGDRLVLTWADELTIRNGVLPH